MKVDLNLPNIELWEFAGTFQLLATACDISKGIILSTWRRQSEFERKEITVTGLHIAFPVLLTSFFSLRFSRSSMELGSKCLNDASINFLL